MEDPEYIGKEELALAEAQQRVRQSLNNHKALAMAKADSPLDTLVNFLKGDNDYFHQRRGHVGASHIISTEVKEPTFEELVGHAKDELLALAPEGTTWEQLIADPKGTFQAGTNSGRLSQHNLYMENLSRQVPGIEADYDDPNPDAYRRTLPKGQNALRELMERAKDHPEAKQLMESLQSRIGFFNTNQTNAQQEGEAERREEGAPGIGFSQVHNFGGFVPPKANRATGEIFNPDPVKWNQALTDVMDPDFNWNDPSYSRWQDEKINLPQNEQEVNHLGMQEKVIDLVETLTGVHYSNPRQALTHLQDIHSRPDQFLKTGEDGQPMMRAKTDDNGSISFVPNIASSGMVEAEDDRHESLADLATHLQTIEASRDKFYHPPTPQMQQFDPSTLEESVVDSPAGVGWRHQQPLSPMQRWILGNATHPDANISDEEAQRNLQREIISRYHRTKDSDIVEQADGSTKEVARDAHGTPKGLETLFADVVRDLGLTVPPAPSNIVDEQEEWPMEYSMNDVPTRDPRYSRADTEEDAPGQYNRIPVNEVVSNEALSDKDPDQLGDMLERGDLSDEQFLAEIDTRLRNDPDSIKDWEGKKVYFGRVPGQYTESDPTNQSALSGANLRVDDVSGKAFAGTPEFGDGNPNEIAEADAEVGSDLVDRWLEIQEDENGERTAVERYRLASEIEDKDAVGGKASRAGELKPGQKAMPELPSNLYSEVPEGHVGLADEPTHTRYGGPREPQVSQNLGHVQRGSIPFDKLDTAPHFDGEEDLQVHPDDLQNYMHHRNFINQMIEYGIPLESITRELPDGTRAWSMEAMERGMQEHGLLQHGESIEDRNFIKPGNQKSTWNGIPPIFPKGRDHRGENPAEVRRNKLHENLSPAEKAQKQVLSNLMEQEWIGLHGGQNQGRGANKTVGQNMEYPYAENQEAISPNAQGKVHTTPAYSTWSPSNARNRPTYTSHEGGFSNAKYLKHVINQAAEATGRNFDKEYEDLEIEHRKAGGEMPSPPPKPATPQELAAYKEAKTKILGPHPRKAFEQELLQEFESKHAGTEVDFNHIMEHFQGKGMEAPHPNTLPMGRTLPGGGGLQQSKEGQQAAAFPPQAPTPPLEQLLQIIGKPDVNYGDLREAVQEQQAAAQPDAIDNILSAIAATIPEDAPDEAPVEESNLSQLENLVADSSAERQMDTSDLTRGGREAYAAEQSPTAEDDSEFGPYGEARQQQGAPWSEPMRSNRDFSTTAAPSAQQALQDEVARRALPAAADVPERPALGPGEAQDPGAREMPGQRARGLQYIPEPGEQEARPMPGEVPEFPDRDTDLYGEGEVPAPAAETPAEGEQPAAEETPAEETPAAEGGVHPAQEPVPWYDSADQRTAQGHVERLGELKESFDKRLAGVQDMYTWPPTDARWYEGQNPVPFTEDVFKAFGVQPGSKDAIRGKGDLKGMQDPGGSGDYGVMISAEQANKDYRANLRAEKINRAVEQLHRHSTAYQKTHDNVATQLGMEPGSEEYEAAREAGGVVQNKLNPDIQVDLTGHGKDAVVKPLTDARDKMTPEFREMVRGGDNNPLENSPQKDTHINHITGEVIRDEDSAFVDSDGKLLSKFERREAPPTEEEAAQDSPIIEDVGLESDEVQEPTESVLPSVSAIHTKLGLDPGDQGANKMDWSPEDIAQYQSELVKMLKDRAKNGAAQNYIDDMVAHMEKSYGKGKPTDVTKDGLFDNGSIVGRLENLANAYGNEYNITIGELGQWGNNNGYFWGATRQSRWHSNNKNGTSNVVQEDGAKNKYWPKGVKFDESRLDPDSLDEEDRSDLEQLDRMTYRPHPDAENYNARFHAEAVKSERDHKTTSIGRANRLGVPHDHAILTGQKNDEGHAAYGNRVHARVEKLAKDMHDNGYHEDGYAGGHGLEDRALALASEISRTKVTDKDEALRILTSDREHGSTGRNHAEPFHNTESYANRHDALHNNARVQEPAALEEPAVEEPVDEASADDAPLQGEVIPRRQIEGDVQQPQEGRVVEGTGRVINGGDESTAQQSAAEEPQQSAEETQPAEVESTEPEVDHLQNAQDEVAKIKESFRKNRNAEGPAGKAILEEAESMLAEAANAAPQRQHDLIARANVHLQELNRGFLGKRPDEEGFNVPSPARELSPLDDATLDSNKKKIIDRINHVDSEGKRVLSATNRGMLMRLVQQARARVDEAQTPGEIHQAILEAHQMMFMADKHYLNNAHAIRNPAMRVPEQGHPTHAEEITSQLSDDEKETFNTLNAEDKQAVVDSHKDAKARGAGAALGDAVRGVLNRFKKKPAETPAETPVVEPAPTEETTTDTEETPKTESVPTPAQPKKPISIEDLIRSPEFQSGTPKEQEQLIRDNVTPTPTPPPSDDKEGDKEDGDDDGTPTELTPADPEHPLHQSKWENKVPAEHVDKVRKAIAILARDKKLNAEAIMDSLDLDDYDAVIKKAKQAAAAQHHKEADVDGPSVRDQHLATIKKLQKDMGREMPDAYYEGMSEAELKAELGGVRKAYKDHQEGLHREAHQQVMDSIPRSLQEQLEEHQKSDPNATITPLMATKQMRQLLLHHNNLAKRGIRATDKTYAAHHEEMKKLMREARDHGADMDRLNKEVEQYGKNKPLENNYGSPEHLAEAEAADNKVEQHGKEYQGIFHPGSEKVMNAYNDPHYHPNAIHKMGEDGKHESTVFTQFMGKYDKKTGAAIHEEVTHEAGAQPEEGLRHNGSASDTHDLPPHILGLTAEQNQEYHKLHKDIQAHRAEHGEDPTTEAGQQSQADLNKRKEDLNASLVKSGHATEATEETEAQSPLDHPHVGASAEDMQKDQGGLDRPPAGKVAPISKVDGKMMHWMPGVGWIREETFRNAQAGVGGGEAMFHPGGANSLIGDDDGNAVDKGMLIDQNGGHAVGMPAANQQNPTHDNMGPVTNQQIRETDLANGLHNITGNATGEVHPNVTHNADGTVHIKDAANAMRDGGSNYGDSDAAQRAATNPTGPKQQKPQTPGGGGGSALGRFKAGIKGAGDAVARQWGEAEGYSPQAVQQQTLGRVARRGISSLAGNIPGIASNSKMVASITGMTPGEANLEHAESLEKLLKFVKSQQ